VRSIEHNTLVWNIEGKIKPAMARTDRKFNLCLDFDLKSEFRPTHLAEWKTFTVYGQGLFGERMILPNSVSGCPCVFLVGIKAILLQYRRSDRMERCMDLNVRCKNWAACPGDRLMLDSLAVQF